MSYKDIILFISTIIFLFLLSYNNCQNYYVDEVYSKTLCNENKILSQESSK